MSAIGIGSSLVFAIRSALLGPGPSNTLQKVRNLDQSNGGDFAVSILDFGKASKRFADFDGTPAGEGDSVALVLDDVSDELGPDLVDQANDASAWNPQGSNTVEMDGGEVKITRVDNTNGAQINLGLTSSALVQTLTSGKWYRVTGNVRVSSGSTTLTIHNGSGVGGPLSVTSTTLVPFHIDFLSDGAEAFRAKTNTSGMSVYVSGIEVKELPGAHAYQTSAASRPVVTTDALDRTPIETDGGDDRLNLPDGWLGDGAEAFTVSMAVAPNAASSESFARLFGSPAHKTEAWLDSGQINFRTADGGSASQPTLYYARPVTDDEPLVLSFSWAPNSAPTMRLNGQQVAEGASAFATLDALTDNTLFGRGTNELAATAWATVSVVGSRAMTDAEIRAVEEYLAELADVTLAPQTREEALTVLRRPATPASDLNVTEDYSSYADTSAFFADAANTDASSGTSSVTIDPSNSRAVFEKIAGSVSSYKRSGDKVRPGFKYRVSIDNATGGTGNRIQIIAGTAANNGDYGSSLAAIGSTASVEFIATQTDLYLTFIGIDAGIVYAQDLRIEEIPRTTAVYDMLDESRMTDSEGGTQALDAGVEILLPSVAEGEDAFGVDISPLGSAANIDNGGGMTGSYDESSGTFTAVGTGTSGRPRWRWTIPDANPETLYRVVATHSGDGIFNDRLVFGGTGKSGTEILPNATSTFLVTGIPSSSNGFAIFGNGTPGTCQVSITIQAVLHYPLQQTTAAAQPTLRYTLHDYLAGVVFSGKETTEGTITSATSLQDLSDSGNAPAVNGSLTVSTPAGVSGSAVGDVYTATGWNHTTISGDPGNSFSTTGDSFTMTHVGSSGRSVAYSNPQSGLSVVSGETYLVRGTVTATAGQVYSVNVADSSNTRGTSVSYTGTGSPQTVSAAVKITGTDPTCELLVQTGDAGTVSGSGFTAYKLPDALSTVYSGFSAGADSLEHTSDHIDPGTGDWSMTVVCRGDAPTNPIMEYGHYTGSYSGGVIRFRTDGNAGNAYTFIVSDDGFVTTDRVRATGTAAGSNDPFDRATVLRRGSQIELWVNGALAEAGTLSNAVGSLSGGVLCVGGGLSGTSWPGEIGTIQLHTSGYAPTADEIGNMHADLDAIYNRTADSYVFASLEYDGGDDFMQAVDPDNDLAITGDLTIVAAVTPDIAGVNLFFVASGDPASINVEEAFAAQVKAGSGLLGLRQADGSSGEIQRSSAEALSDGEGSVVSLVRRGADVTLAVDVQDPETKTFATVTAPTAGASPQTIVGAIEDGSFNFDGSYSGLAIYDGALPTGQVVVLESAMQKLSSGG